jgi:hypothetical protein
VLYLCYIKKGNNMKNQLVINLDTENTEYPIQIGKFENAPQGDMKEIMLLDIATICEALVTLIKHADENGIKTKSEALKDCIIHIEDGIK